MDKDNLSPIFGGDFSEGAREEKFREFEEEFSDEPEVVDHLKATWLADRGNNRGEEGDLEEAIKDFKAAIELKNDHIPAYLSLGVAYENQGEHEKAKKVLKSTPSKMMLKGEVVTTKEEAIQSVMDQAQK